MLIELLAFDVNTLCPYPSFGVDIHACGYTRSYWELLAVWLSHLDFSRNAVSGYIVLLVEVHCDKKIGLSVGVDTELSVNVGEVSRRDLDGISATSLRLRNLPCENDSSIFPPHILVLLYNILIVAVEDLKIGAWLKLHQFILSELVIPLLPLHNGWRLGGRVHDKDFNEHDIERLVDRLVSRDVS